MRTAIINVKTTPDTKSKAQYVAEELGFGLSSLINGFLKHLIKTRTIEFSAYSKEEPTEYLMQALKEAEVQRKKGEVISFKNPHDAVTYVENLIKKK